jgi:parallel beta-helix repeat protein
MKLSSLTLAALCAALVACGSDDDGGDDGTAANFPVNRCATIDSPHCQEIPPGDVDALLNAANSIEPGTTLVLGEGTFTMTNGLSIRTAGAHLVGQGIDRTTLDFGMTTTQVNGIDVIGNDFLVQDLTVKDSPKDGIRVEASKGVVFRRIRATWSTLSDPSNGSYGIYPVKSENVLVEDSRAENASDAGLYVGQCQHVIIRNNTVSGNVAGLEIENTQYADVYGNTAEDNTGGIVIFDLPGNPIVGHDVRLRDNVIRNNNHVNFAPGGTVESIPVGTGTFALASRRVEITGNTYENNHTGDIAILSGLAIESDASKWELPTATLVGNWSDLELLPGSKAGTITNFRSENIVVADNQHMGSGTMPDPSDPLMMGLLFSVVYGADPVDSVLYDAIGETEFNSTDAALNSNDNHICVGDNREGSFASMNLATQSEGITPFFRPAFPFAPFDCTSLPGGPVEEVVL